MLTGPMTLPALRIAREFDIDLTFEHASEAHPLPTRWRVAGVPAIVGPSLGIPGKGETQDPGNGADSHRSGVTGP